MIESDSFAFSAPQPGVGGNSSNNSLIREGSLCSPHWDQLAGRCIPEVLNVSSPQFLSASSLLTDADNLAAPAAAAEGRSRILARLDETNVFSPSSSVIIVEVIVDGDIIFLSPVYEAWTYGCESVAHMMLDARYLETAVLHPSPNPRCCISIPRRSLLELELQSLLLREAAATSNPDELVLSGVVAPPAATTHLASTHHLSQIVVLSGVCLSLVTKSLKRYSLQVVFLSNNVPSWLQRIGRDASHSGVSGSRPRPVGSRLMASDVAFSEQRTDVARLCARLNLSCISKALDWATCISHTAEVPTPTPESSALTTPQPALSSCPTEAESRHTSETREYLHDGVSAISARHDGAQIERGDTAALSSAQQANVHDDVTAWVFPSHPPPISDADDDVVVATPLGVAAAAATRSNAAACTPEATTRKSSNSATGASDTISASARNAAARTCGVLLTTGVLSYHVHCVHLMWNLCAAATARSKLHAKVMVPTEPLGATDAEKPDAAQAPNPSDPLLFSWHDEFFARQGASKQWRLCHINKNFSVTPSYPEVVVVPSGADDSIIRHAAVSERCRGRFEVLSYFCSATGAVVARSSQPQGTNIVSSLLFNADRLVKALQSHTKSNKLIVFDLRSDTAAATNFAIGGGKEMQLQVHHCELPNIHAVRSSYNALRKLVAESEAPMVPVMQQQAAAAQASPTSALFSGVHTVSQFLLRTIGAGGGAGASIAVALRQHGSVYRIKEGSWLHPRTKPSTHQKALDATHWVDYIHLLLVAAVDCARLVRGMPPSFQYHATNEASTRIDVLSGKQDECLDDAVFTNGAAAGIAGMRHLCGVAEQQLCGPDIPTSEGVEQQRSTRSGSALASGSVDTTNSDGARTYTSALRCASADDVRLAGMHGVHSRCASHGSSQSCTRRPRCSSSVLLHCSDGWDRTSQVSALTQLLLDPYFRTVRGFCALLEREFCQLGHPMRTRLDAFPAACGLTPPSPLAAASAQSAATDDDFEVVDVSSTGVISITKTSCNATPSKESRQDRESDSDMQAVQVSDASAPRQKKMRPPPVSTPLTSATPCHSAIATSPPTVSISSETSTPKQGASRKTSCAPGSGLGEASTEWSPIVLQYFDAVAQLLHSYPTEFEFTEQLLLMLWDMLSSGFLWEGACDSAAGLQSAMTTAVKTACCGDDAASSYLPERYGFCAAAALASKFRLGDLVDAIEAAHPQHGIDHSVCPCLLLNPHYRKRSTTKSAGVVNPSARHVSPFSTDDGALLSFLPPSSIVLWSGYFLRYSPWSRHVVAARAVPDFSSSCCAGEGKSLFHHSPDHNTTPSLAVTPSGRRSAEQTPQGSQLGGSKSPAVSSESRASESTTRSRAAGIDIHRPSHLSTAALLVLEPPEAATTASRTTTPPLAPVAQSSASSSNSTNASPSLLAQQRHRRVKGFFCDDSV